MKACLPLFLSCVLIAAGGDAAPAPVPTNALVAAEPSSNAQPPLTLRAALATALEHSPALRARALQVSAADARAERAAMRTPLTLSADFENFVGTGDLAGIDALETTVRLGSVIELGERRQRRTDVALRERDIETVRAERERLRVLADVAAAFIAVAEAQSTLALRQQDIALADATVKAVRQRIEIGAAPRFERTRAEIELTQARIRLEHHAHTLAASQRRLHGLMGTSGPGVGRVAADLFVLPDTADVDTLLLRLDRNPDLRVLAAEAEAARSRIGLAEAGRRPDVAVSAGIRRLEAQDDAAFVVSFSMPLGAERRAAPDVREARSLLDSNAEQHRAARIELETQLFELVQELNHARFELQTLRTRVEGQARDVVRQVELGFREGRYSFQEYANAQRQLSEIRRTQVEVAARFHTLLVGIERLTGTSATAATPIPGSTSTTSPEGH